MYRFSALIATLCLFASSQLALAAESTTSYKQSTLPDGSVVVESSSSDGSHVKQITRKDGTVEIDATDGKGNHTTSIQHPDGSVESKTTTKN